MQLQKLNASQPARLDCRLQGDDSVIKAVPEQRVQKHMIVVTNQTQFIGQSRPLIRSWNKTSGTFAVASCLPRPDMLSCTVDNHGVNFF